MSSVVCGRSTFSGLIQRSNTAPHLWNTVHIDLTKLRKQTQYFLYQRCRASVYELILQPPWKHVHICKPQLHLSILHEDRVMVTVNLQILIHSIAEKLHPVAYTCLKQPGRNGWFEIYYSPRVLQCMHQWALCSSCTWVPKSRTAIIFYIHDQVESDESLRYSCHF